MFVKRLVALVLVLSFWPTVTVNANVQITTITDATVTQIVSTSGIRVQLSGGRTALVRINGVSPIVGVPNNNEHARAFLHNSVLGREVRLVPPDGAPRMDGRFNVMTVVLDGVNIAERINGDTLPVIVDVLPERPTIEDLRFAGQLFVNRNGQFIPHYRGDGFDNEPLWFFYDGQFFRFNTSSVGRTLLYFRSNGHFYPFFPTGNTNFTGNLFFINESGDHENYIPGRTGPVGRVYFWSQGAYHLYVPWFWGQMHFPWATQPGSDNNGGNNGANAAGARTAVATPTPTPTPTPAPVATPAPSAANNGPVVQYHPTLGRMYLHGARSAGAQTNNAQLRSTPQPTPAPAPASATQQQADIQNPRSWHPGGTWQQGNVSNLWNWDGLNLSGMEQWMGFGRYGAQQPAETWGQSEHPWQWWSANNPWYWAGTNNPWQWGLDIPRQVYDENGEPRLNADGTPMMWNEEFGHPYQWHANQQGNPGRPGSFPWTNNDGSGLWDPNASTPWGSGNPGPWAANSMWQFDADPGLGEGDGYNPWRWGFVNYPNLGFIWKPQLYLRGGNGEYIPYFPGITNHIGQVYILQGTEFVPYRPRFDGPREWEYFSFEENAQDLFHNFRDPQWDQHVGSLYFFDHHAGRFLPYFGPPLR